jgi:hypothetical protein
LRGTIDEKQRVRRHLACLHFHHFTTLTSIVTLILPHLSKNWKHVTTHSQHFTEALPDLKSVISFLSLSLSLPHATFLFDICFLFSGFSFYCHNNGIPSDKMVYLSAEGKEEITEIDPNMYYVIGALVDRNRHKGPHDRIEGI